MPFQDFRGWLTVDGVSRVKIIDDQIIELLVRQPSALTEEMRRTVEDYTNSDPFGRAVAQFYRDYYEELDALDDSDTGVVGSQRRGPLPAFLSARHLG